MQEFRRLSNRSTLANDSSRARQAHLRKGRLIAPLLRWLRSECRGVSHSCSNLIRLSLMHLIYFQGNSSNSHSRVNCCRLWRARTTNLIMQNLINLPTMNQGTTCSSLKSTRFVPGISPGRVNFSLSLTKLSSTYSSVCRKVP